MAREWGGAFRAFVSLSGTREVKGKVVVQLANPQSELPLGGALEWAGSPIFSVGHMRVESPSTALFGIHTPSFHRLNTHTQFIFQIMYWIQEDVKVIMGPECLRKTLISSLVTTPGANANVSITSLVK